MFQLIDSLSPQLLAMVYLSDMRWVLDTCPQDDSSVFFIGFQWFMFYFLTLI